VRTTGPGGGAPAGLDRWCRPRRVGPVRPRPPGL